MSQMGEEHDEQVQEKPLSVNRAKETHSTRKRNTVV